MLYKINDNVIYRREMDNVLMLSPKTKKLFIFKKDVAESIDYTVIHPLPAIQVAIF